MLRQWWFFFECLNWPCAERRGVCIDVRRDSKDGEAPPALSCPECGGEMRFAGRVEADEGGYKPASNGDLLAALCVLFILAVLLGLVIQSVSTP